jgi:hypothetical protein
MFVFAIHIAGLRISFVKFLNHRAPSERYDFEVTFHADPAQFDDDVNDEVEDGAQSK